MSLAPRIDEVESRVQGLDPLEAAVDTQYIDAPHTTVQNRAKMVDLSNDLRPRMGIERIHTHEVVHLPSESSSSGEAVYKPANDSMDQIRLVWLLRFMFLMQILICFRHFNSLVLTPLNLAYQYETVYLKRRIL